MKADPDTYINLIALSERLSCFDSGSPLFLGAVHAAVPPRHLQEQWPALFFGQGGCGYIGRGLRRR
ncbi:unnamed protein product [Prorocentrum cordatum]|uniref:Uncharacterized protein n=1 Tax=Prorocentrum cordatum TaxID=2364126 RepID=A0ABN9X8D6_9DINO|nr:unnamed protein product [Polarella glacialis]